MSIIIYDSNFQELKIKKITTSEHVSLTRVSDEDGKGLKEIHMIPL